MSEIRAVFMDIDNTLLSHSQNAIPACARKALHMLGEKGIMRVLATGRHYIQMQTLPDVLDHEYEGYILLEGQLSLDKNREVVCSSPLQGEALEEVLSLFNRKEISVFFFEPDRIYANFYDDVVEELRRGASWQVPGIGTYDGGDLLMASVFADVETEAKLAPHLPHCKRDRWNAMGMDLIAKNAGKINGIRRFMEAEGLLPEEIIAFGDGENDIEMLQMAGIGVAMGNASEAVKRAADYVTDDIDEDGLYKALVHFRIL